MGMCGGVATNIHCVTQQRTVSQSVYSLSAIYLVASLALKVGH